MSRKLEIDVRSVRAEDGGLDIFAQGVGLHGPIRVEGVVMKHWSEQDVSVLGVAYLVRSATFYVRNQLEDRLFEAMDPGFEAGGVNPLDL